MCLAVPAKIIKLIDSENALCDFNGIEKEVNVSLIENPAAGDWVIVHVGFALNRIDSAQARQTQELLKSMAAEGKKEAEFM